MSTSSLLHMTCNPCRNDIVDVSIRHGNNTLAVKATKPGQVMLKVNLFIQFGVL